MRVRLLLFESLLASSDSRFHDLKTQRADGIGIGIGMRVFGNEKLDNFSLPLLKS